MSYPVQQLRKALYSAGYKPLPVLTGDKRPEGTGWPERARQGEVVQNGHWPSADALNTGILADGLRLVDVDVNELALAAQIEELAAEVLGPAPARRRANSARFLLLYRAAKGEPRKRFIAGVDVLGVGCQAVIAGTHPSGAAYVCDLSAWPVSSLTAVTEKQIGTFLAQAAAVLSVEPEQVAKAAPAPTAATDVEITSRHRAYGENAVNDELTTFAATPANNGKRNAALFVLGATIGNFVSGNMIEEQPSMLRVWDHPAVVAYRAKDGDDEIWKTLQSGVAAGKLKPRTMPPDIDTSHIANMTCNGKPIGATMQTPEAWKPPVKSTWPEPLDIATVNVGIAGAFVQMLAPHTEADPNALLIAFLTAMGAIIGSNPHIMRGADRHGTNIFTTLVGATATGRKGTATSEVRAFVSELDTLFRKRIISGLTSGEGIIDAVRDEQWGDVSAKDQGNSSVVRKIVKTAVEDKRLLVIEGEFAQPLKLAKREGNNLSVVLRNAWDAVPLQTLAKTAAAVCEKPHISIIGNITPDELLRELTGNDQSNGYGNRFLWVCATRSGYLPHGGSPDPAQRAEITLRAQKAFVKARDVRAIDLDDEARALWEQHYQRLSDRPEDTVGMLTQRATAQVLRIALIYALLDDRTDEPCTAVGAAHLRAALEVWRYCEESVRYIFGQGVGSTDADKLLGWLKSRPAGMSKTAISNEVWRGNSKPGQANAALQRLIEAGLVRAEMVGKAEVWFAV